MEIFSLVKKLISSILTLGCARRGASGALYPKSALCGAESPLEGLKSGVEWTQLIGRCATDGHEPRQVREEAAISDAGCVAVDPGHGNELWLSKQDSTAGAQPLFECGMRNAD